MTLPSETVDFAGSQMGLSQNLEPQIWWFIIDHTIISKYIKQILIKTIEMSMTRDIPILWQIYVVEVRVWPTMGYMVHLMDDIIPIEIQWEFPVNTLNTLGGEFVTVFPMSMDWFKGKI